MPVRKVVSLHAPMAASTAMDILSPAISQMEKFGFRWWISTDELPDVVLMIDSPEAWMERGPTQKELAHFYELWERGEKDEARKFARVGFPEGQR